LGGQVGAKPQPSRSKTQKFRFIDVRLESGASAPLVFFQPYDPHGSRAFIPEMDGAHVSTITSDARQLQYAWCMVHLAQETLMRTIILAATALAAVSLTSIHAYADGAWCARDVLGGTNCGFYTYEQCRADIVGIGGSCVPNLNYTGASQNYGRDPRRRPRQY
jgi:hypothetical protein